MNIDQIHKESVVKAVTSSGAGGQHVNKVATKVQLYFHVGDSLAFAEAEHKRILSALTGTLTKEGVLIVSNQNTRSQAQNKANAFKALTAILTDAAVIKKVRRKKSIPKAVKRRRQKEKRKHSEKKQDRKFKHD
jgi:ribosome-associated protein